MTAMGATTRSLMADIPAWFHHSTSRLPMPVFRFEVEDKQVTILLFALPSPVCIELPAGVGVDLAFEALGGRRLHLTPQPRAIKVFMHGVPYRTHEQPLRTEDLLRGYIATNFDFWGEGPLKVETPQYGRALPPLSDLCDHDLDGDADMTPMSYPSRYREAPSLN